jgi:uncharacterized damage-inducible protein DinB
MDAPVLDLRYPIGKFVFPAATPSAEEARDAVAAIAAAPNTLRAAIAGLNETQLDTPYRPGGWTVRQTIHHVADSHMNSYMRFRLALTEDLPAIKPYDEAAWALLADASTAAPEVSLTLLDAMHVRWVLLMQSMGPAEWARMFRHPDRPAPMRLDVTAMLYAWHGKHHAAHVTRLRERQGW